MSLPLWQSNWHPVTNHEAHQITGSSETPGLVYPYPLDALPTSLQKLPGIYASFVSGYLHPYTTPEDVMAKGEVLVARTDEGLGKGYVWLFGISGSGVYTAGPYKPYDGHHFETASGVPTDKLFGQVPQPKG